MGREIFGCTEQGGSIYSLVLPPRDLETALCTLVSSSVKWGWKQCLPFRVLRGLNEVMQVMIIEFSNVSKTDRHTVSKTDRHTEN